MLYAIRNNDELEGVYTKETFNPEWAQINGLSIRHFKDEDRDKAEKWVYDKEALERAKKRKAKAKKSCNNILNQIRCEVCTFVDHCDGVFCLKG